MQQPPRNIHLSNLCAFAAMARDKFQEAIGKSQPESTERFRLFDEIIPRYSKTGESLSDRAITEASQSGNLAILLPRIETLWAALQTFCDEAVRCPQCNDLEPICKEFWALEDAIKALLPLIGKEDEKSLSSSPKTITSMQGGGNSSVSRLRSIADELERMATKAGKYKEDEAEKFIRSILDRLGPEYSTFKQLELKYGYHPKCRTGAPGFLDDVNGYHGDRNYKMSVVFFDSFVWYLVRGLGGCDDRVKRFFGQLRVWADLIENEPEGASKKADESPGNATPINSVEWSRPKAKKFWADIFDLHVNTMAAWLKNQTIRNEQVSPRKWRVDIRELPMAIAKTERASLTNK